MLATVVRVIGTRDVICEKEADCVNLFLYLIYRVEVLDLFSLSVCKLGNKYMKLICCNDEGVIEIQNVGLALYGNWYDIDTLARTMYIHTEQNRKDFFL
jgi:hypothetical protein